MKTALQKMYWIVGTVCCLRNCLLPQVVKAETERDMRLVENRF